MLTLDQIRKYFPEEVSEFGLDMLREYLQYQILKAIFESKYADKYTFLGGTCLRIAYKTERFSEDLDFDNAELTQAEFEETGKIVKRWLELLGFNVSIRFSHKGAFHCHVKFPALLFDYGLSGHKEAKLLIKLDTEKQHYDYIPNIHQLNNFGVNADIRVTPLPLLASQKVAAVMGRKRPKGRDFYDLHWILQRTTPDYGYLIDRFEVNNAVDLRKMVKMRIAQFDFNHLARDVQPFLFSRGDVALVRQFPEFWEGVRL